MESLIPNSRDNSTTSTEFEEDNNEAMASPSSKYYNLVVATLIVFSLVVGYIAAVQPTGAGWRYFSWHPFLMVTGFVGMMGTAAATKKLGGYKNTKIHGIMASLGLFMAFGGLYVIYKNKEMMGKEHLTSTHSIAGIVTMAGCTMAMMAGGIFLHPDFGVDKTNQTIRFAHKWFGRSVMFSGWVTCFLGLKHLTSDIFTLALFCLPLLALAPFTLV